MYTRRNRLWITLAALAVTAVFVSRSATAAAPSPYTATGWITGVPVLPLTVTNALGQVLLRANVHTVMVQTDDSRLTGNRTVIVNGGYNADGTAALYGSVYQEVGTWHLTDPNLPKFTPTGGLWELDYSGAMGADGSLRLNFVGRGQGGTIDGLRLEEDLTRAAGAILDPAIPYLYTGTIKPPPENTTAVVDNFDDNHFTGATWGTGTVSESNQQLVVRGSFQGVKTSSILDSYVFGGPANALNVPEGKTLEWRADLVSLDSNATNTAILAVGTPDGLYVFHKGSAFEYLFKWTQTSGFSMLACGTTPVRNTDVVLSLALTRMQPNLVITARVLDKAAANAVLYQCTVVDTPNADPTLTVSQFEALTGMRLTDLGPDQKANPLASFLPLLGVFQYTDGSEPAPTAIFDNLELRTYEIPQVSIERAVRLMWPADDTANYGLESATTVIGPWLPVQELSMPGMQQMTAPASGAAKIFRVRGW